MAIRRVVFIRTGETAWNAAGRWQGWVAAPLSEHGREQAAALARLVRTLGLGALYSSDLERGRETAAIITEGLAFEPTFDVRLRERGIGHWQGLTLDEIAAWYADEFAALQADPEHYAIEGGESRAQVRERMRDAFNAITRADIGETVAVLSHTSALKLLLSDLIPGYEVLGRDIGNTAVTSIQRESEGWTLISDNDRTHLYGLTASAVGELETRL